jgi:hypothetical protein
MLVGRCSSPLSNHQNLKKIKKSHAPLRSGRDDKLEGGGPLWHESRGMDRSTATATNRFCLPTFSSTHSASCVVQKAVRRLVWTALAESSPGQSPAYADKRRRFSPEGTAENHPGLCPGATLRTEISHGPVVTILMRASGKPALQTHRKPCFLFACQFDSSFLSGGGVVFPHRVWFQLTACSPSWLG